MKFREVDIEIPNGFGSASSTIFKKKALMIYIYLNGMKNFEWEVTYSPSMGEDYYEIKEALNQRSKSKVLSNHIKWINFLNADTTDVCKKNPIICLQVDLCKRLVKIPQEYNSLRVKASQTAPKWLYNCEGSISSIIIDYNNSSDKKGIITDVKRLRLKYPDIKIFIEQPYEYFYLEKIQGVTYIFDEQDVFSFIDYVEDGDIVSLKLGRNTPEEYKALLDRGKNINFGNVISTEQGELICQEINALYSTQPISCINL